ncbi:hypothetical protein LEMLEM_LOCUS8881 [Lemmus lemmus]
MQGRRGESIPGVASPAARSLSPGTQVPAPAPSKGDAVRPCGGPGTGWWVPGRVARSRAQDARRTRAWPPPPQSLPARHGSLPCRRPGSRRSARSPWRRAIRTARPAQCCSPSRSARSATPRSTWDVALAAARAGPHSPPGDGLRAAGAAATPQTAPPSGSRRERPESGRPGRQGAPSATPGYGAPEWTRLI